MPKEEAKIKRWLIRIDSSHLSTRSFFEQNKVPFCRTQYYKYKRMLNDEGELKLSINRGGNQKIGDREELFLRGYLSGGASISIDEIRMALQKELGVAVNRSTVSRALTRLLPDYMHLIGKRKNKNLISTINPMGGFELIIAVACHLEWHERAGMVIAEAISELKINWLHSESKVRFDLKGRNKEGQFTKLYNQRKDVRSKRFLSVDDKRDEKNWNSMNIMHDQISTLFRKNLALLSLPIVTGNGHVRTVNLPHGQALNDLCGFNYKQSTLNKFLGELKYLGISERLQKDLPEFWNKCWGKDVYQNEMPALCYYVDGNTKAVWSSKRIKQNKVTMLGKVMGCLEQVFIHDGLGHPIYFETYSGRGPVGEHMGS